jgi:hypothetical protein
MGRSFVAEHAGHLFAIWDGKPARGVGGTGQVVKWFLANHVPRGSLHPGFGAAAGTLAGGTPTLLIHIDPKTGQIGRRPVEKAPSK